jgi:hypothetical protein
MGKLTIRWWDWIEWPWRRWQVDGWLDAADEVPEKLPPRSVIAIGSEDYPKWAVFDCPCGRGHRIMLSLSSGSSRRWHLEAMKPITLAPSIDSWHAGVRCHYFIRNGKVLWVRD